MRTTKAQLYVHLVWGTWDRLALIEGEIKRIVYASMISEAKRARCEIVAIGGVSDHVHLLVAMRPDISISDLVKRLKACSSLAAGPVFRWQSAYGAFSIGRNDIPRLANYIENQAAHHASRLNPAKAG